MSERSKELVSSTSAKAHGFKSRRGHILLNNLIMINRTNPMQEKTAKNWQHRICPSLFEVGDSCFMVLWVHICTLKCFVTKYKKKSAQVKAAIQKGTLSSRGCFPRQVPCFILIRNACLADLKYPSGTATSS